MALGKKQPKFWSRELHKKLIMRFTPVLPHLGERDRRIPGSPWPAGPAGRGASGSVRVLVSKIRMMERDTQ